MDEAELQHPPLPEQGARLVWLGHASWLVQLGGLSLIIDPVLRPRVGVLIKRNGAAPVAMKALPPIAAQLVTHNHHDHMELSSLRALASPVIAGLGTARITRNRPKTVELGWWDSVDLGTVKVTFVPSQHWSRRGLFDANRSLWGGFVIQSGGLSIYHAGDTAYFAGFAEIGRRFPAIDAALLPIGAYAPEWFMSRQHMNPPEALHAFTDLGARQMIAMHWGTFKLTDEALDEPPRWFHDSVAERGISGSAARVVDIGETVALGRLG